MRRLLSALGVIGLASALVFSAAPAHAVPAPPPPVAEYPYKPSALVAGTGTTESGAEARARVRAEVQAKIRAGVPQNPTNQPRFLAPPTSGTRVPFGGGAAGPLMLVQLAPALTNLGLQMWVTSAESGLDMTAEELICSTVGGANIGFVDFLYGVTPECRAIYTAPNNDKQATMGPLSFNGFTASFTQLIPGYYYQTACFQASSSVPPQGYSLYQMGHNGQVTSMSLGGGASSFGCSAPATHIQGVYSSTGTNVGYPDAPGFWVSPSGQPNNKVAQFTEVRPDPQRQVRCRTDWSDGSQTVGLGEIFRESEGLSITAEGLGCTHENFVSDPGGPWPDRIRIEQEEGGSITTIADMPVPAEAQPATPEEAPKPTRGLVLQKVVEGVEASCMTWDADCADWWEESQQGTNSETYRCTYQGAQISLAECGVYRNTFKDVDPDTGESVITDPVTGTNGQWGSAPGTNNNSTSPTSGPTPGDVCMSSWPSSPNPIAWVMRPVQCALVWAFVPRNEKIAEFNTKARDDIDNSIPGVALGTVVGFSALFEVANGCGGLPFVIDVGEVHVDTMLFAACEEPMAGVAATVKGVLTFVVLAGAVLAVIRYGGGLFGFNPFGIVDPRADESGVRFR